MDDYYISRCRKSLKELGAPLDGWSCVGMQDYEDASFICELCGCDKVRYVHEMKNDNYHKHLYVGCICAGIMEDDIIAAQARDSILRNRARRKRYFPKRNWHTAFNGDLFVKYHDKNIFIHQFGKYYSSCVDGQWIYRYKGKGIVDFTSACYAAFDLADPVGEV